MNGVVAGTWDIAPAQQPGNYTNQWRFGTHVRGPSSMDIEYLYAVSEDDTNPYLKPDQTNFLDIVNGGFASGFVNKVIKYNYANISPCYKWPYVKYTFPQTINQSHMILDEYGPVVHEVRTFDVAFNVQTVPVSSSFLYVTNPLVEVMSYQSDAFGANFMLANAGRQNVIVNGTDDTLTGGSNTTINQTCLIYGRCVYTAQNDYVIIKKDDEAIRKQGLIRTQFTTRYIQTSDMANDIADWIVKLWATGVDEVAVEMFGNPLLQVGDLVTMNFPVKGMYPATHQYFITDIKNSFAKGYKTSLTLRRAHVTAG
jgi:hypothetical protein